MGVGASQSLERSPSSYPNQLPASKMQQTFLPTNLVSALGFQWQIVRPHYWAVKLWPSDSDQEEMKSGILKGSEKV